MCVGCRVTAPRSALVRLVLADDTRVVVDERASAPGRGGWLHPRQDCLDQALRRGGVARALRQQRVDTTAVVAWFQRSKHPQPDTRPAGASEDEQRERDDTPMGTR